MGIDEAGKGCVIGPLVIGVVVWNKENIFELEKIDVLDSKNYTTKAQKNLRKNLADQVKTKAENAFIRLLHPEEIDKAIRANKRSQYNSTSDKMNLNILEISEIAKVMIENPCSKIYVDSLGTPPYFIRTLKEILSKKHSDKISQMVIDKTDNSLNIMWNNKINNELISKVIAENKADSKYRIVSAASIIAKVYRDKEIRLIEEKNELDKGILASGYANNQLIPFLKKYENMIKKKRFDFIRYQWNWQPLQTIMKPKKGSLKNFIKK